ncbi:lytic transglycosylase domain-containing protein [Candidatus Pacearchaeota archaeon]|jgi:hypothetical protein|nr:lytic transglycosylase domain-containing protein [Candidatus Pacearchaeota archaeon]
MKNKRGDIPVIILAIAVFVICSVALASFYSSDIDVRNSFVGIGQVQKLNAQIEENYFYGTELSEVGISEGGDLYNAMDYASENKLVNRKCSCGDSCNSYVDFILESASKYEIDPFMFLSLMMQESDCTSKAFSGSSVGLMQINLIHCGKYGLLEDKDKCKEQLLNNIQLNIEVGAKILKESYETSKDGRVFQGCSNRNITYFGWEAALRGYNGWGCGTDGSGNKIYSQDSYVEEVVERTELLKKSANYIETNSSEGYLWWKTESFAFSVEYLNDA